MKRIILKLFKNKNNKQVSATFCKRDLDDSIKKMLDKKKKIRVLLEDEW